MNIHYSEQRLVKYKRLVDTLIYIAYSFLVVYYVVVLCGTIFIYEWTPYVIVLAIFSSFGIVSTGMICFSRFRKNDFLVMASLRYVLVNTPLTFALTELILVQYDGYSFIAVIRDVSLMGLLLSMLVRRYFIIKRALMKGSRNVR